MYIQGVPSQSRIRSIIFNMLVVKENCMWENFIVATIFGREINLREADKSLYGFIRYRYVMSTDILRLIRDPRRCIRWDLRYFFEAHSISTVHAVFIVENTTDQRLPVYTGCWERRTRRFVSTFLANSAVGPFFLRINSTLLPFMRTFEHLDYWLTNWIPLTRVNSIKIEQTTATNYKLEQYVDFNAKVNLE